MKNKVYEILVSQIANEMGNYYFYNRIANHYEKLNYKGFAKYFKDDPDMITTFWLSHYEYNLTDFKHRYLLRRLFETVGFKQSLVKALLDKIDDTEILSQMGVIRVKRDEKVFYRIRVGSHTD